MKETKVGIRQFRVALTEYVASATLAAEACHGAGRYAGIGARQIEMRVGVSAIELEVGDSLNDLLQGPPA